MGGAPPISAVRRGVAPAPAKYEREPPGRDRAGGAGTGRAGPGRGSAASTAAPSAAGVERQVVPRSRVPPWQVRAEPGVAVGPGRGVFPAAVGVRGACPG